MSKRWFILVLCVFCISYAQSQGCSQCKMLAEQGSELNEDSFGSNINYGILYLMIIPYLLLVFLFRKRIIRLFKALTQK